MKTITINIPKDLHRQFKIAVIKKGYTMTSLILDYIKKIIKEDKNGK